MAKHCETRRRLFKVYHDGESQSYVVATDIAEALKVMAADGCTEINRIDIIRDDANISMGFGDEPGRSYVIATKTAEEWATEYGRYIPCVIGARCHE